MKEKFIYDRGVDSLAVFTGRKTYASIEIGDEVIVGLDKHNKVSGVEILNPDKLFRISKKSLGSISSASLTSKIRGGVLWVYVFLKIHDMEKEIPIPICVQNQ